MTDDAVDALLADQPDMLTPDEVADLLRVTLHTVARWRREGQLKAFTIGRIVRIQKDDLRTFLQDAYKKPNQRGDK